MQLKRRKNNTKNVLFFSLLLVFNYIAANELICYYNFSFIKLFQKFLRVLV